MVGIGEQIVRTNEGIRVQEALSCLLCNSEGVLLYQELRDRLFGAPGTWTLMRCPQCHLVWLNPRPVPEDIGKLYEHYFTHNADSNVLQRAGLKHAIRNAVLVARLGYEGLADGLVQKGLGKVVSWIGPIREIVELGVMMLNGQKRGKLLDVGCGNGQFLTS